MDFDLQMPPDDDKAVRKIVREAIGKAMKARYCKARNIVITNKTEISYD